MSMALQQGVAKKEFSGLMEVLIMKEAASTESKILSQLSKLQKGNAMKIKWIMFAATLMLFVHAQAVGETLEQKQLITPTLWVQAPDMFACNLTNVDHKTHTVQVRIITNGKVLLESTKLPLEPKHTANHTVEGLPKGAPIYCEFTIEGAKDMYRGAAKLFPAPTNSDFTASDYSAASDFVAIAAQ